MQTHVSPVDIESSPSFDQHEQVAFINDPETGLRAFIGVHNTNLGPAVGGCRMYPYASDQEALEDVLRLSRGMTYKSALAGLPFGGGKAVIIGDPHTQKTPELMQKMGEFIEQQQGKYITAEDSGTSVADLNEVAKSTQHVLGISADQEFGGDPSPLTALGIYLGIEAAVNYKLAKDTLDGVRVTIQGVGSVGRYLAKHLIAAGAKVLVSDINEQNLALAEDLGAAVLGLDQVLTQEADVFAPCAMGGVINDKNIDRFAVPIIAGGANNQLAEPRHGVMLKEKGILYAPDFVINAGGIIEVCRQYQGQSLQQGRAKISEISTTLQEIFDRSDASGRPTDVVAEELAEQRFNTKL